VPYKIPEPDVVAIIDAPPTPVALLAPGGRFIALVHYESHPPISLLERRHLRLAGIRVDPVLVARQRVRRLTGLSVLRLEDGTERTVTLPDGAQPSVPAWSPDGRSFVFTVDEADGVGVWVADAESATARQVPGLRVRDVLGGDPLTIGAAARWTRDGSSLLALGAPGGAPVLPEAPVEPRIEETAGKRSQMATYQDLLQTDADADAFEALATTVPLRVEPDTGAAKELGPPGLYQRLSDSPDGEHLLVHRLRRPFSFRVPYQYFARSAEVWSAGGALERVIAELGVSDEVPRQGVPTGPRHVSWEERSPASLVWTEALDGGDPVAPAEHRDRVMGLAAPFTGEPESLFEVQHRCLGWLDLDEPHQLLLTEHDRDRRWLTTWVCDLNEPDRRWVLFDHSMDDAYADPGSLLMATNPDGSRTVLQDGSSVYLRGDGSTPDGDRPFLDRLDLATKEKERLFQSPPDRLDHMLGFPAEPPAAEPPAAEPPAAEPPAAEPPAAEPGPEPAEPGTTPARTQILLWHESKADPPNLYLAALDGSAARALTAWPDPHPQLTTMEKRLVVYDRGDGVQLSGMLHLPPGYDPATGGRLPLLIWAYPLDYGDAATAGQVRGSSNRFTRLNALEPTWFVLRGYAVLSAATMPVIGDPETMNDTFIEQITAAAQAHVRALDEMGIVDQARVVVGGHSYGGFMTANLLAHTDLFAAGIARSGAYNRTLTPFGFQAERRSFWEAAAIYDQMSPFRYANRITAPLLLIHGEQDSNSGTFPIQSERLYQAIQGNGGTARLVLLPYESHGYLARESVLDVLAEQFDWLRRWLG
jgi:dipeptidyl aminopeptidase/acylaminoacyl peptidase